MMHSRCLAPAALPPSRAPAGAMLSGTRSTWRAAHTTEWVPAQTTTSCLDSVKAKYLGSVMAAAGSEGEAEAGVDRYAESNHGALKKDVVEAVEEALRNPRAELARLRGEKTFPEEVARDGVEKAQEHSNRTMRERVTHGVGLGLVVPCVSTSTRTSMCRAQSWLRSISIRLE